MSKKAVSFDSLRINSPAQATVAMSPAAPVATQRAASGAGKAGKTIPVRLTVEQWYDAKEFAMREDRSLQDLFIAGLNALRAAKGLPPLTGTAR